VTARLQQVRLCSFVGAVANPLDILLFTKESKKSSARRAPTEEAVAAAAEENDDDGQHHRESIRTLLRDELTAGAKPLRALRAPAMIEALDRFVAEDSSHALSGEWCLDVTLCSGLMTCADTIDKRLDSLQQRLSSAGLPRTAEDVTRWIENDPPEEQETRPIKRERSNGEEVPPKRVRV
jgi:hypothetical protein